MYETLPLEKELSPIFLQKLPAFPDEIKEVIVKIAPWLVLIGIIFGGLGVLAAVGLGTFVSVASIGAAAYGSLWQYWISIIGLGIVVVLYLMAFGPLRNRQRRGWNLLYYALLVNLVVWLVTFSIVSLLIGGFLGFWILFQVREKYS
jgi:hypothetical protein